MPELPTSIVALTTEPNPQDAIWARFLAPFLDGREGFMHHIECPGESRPADLLPINSVVASFTRRESAMLLAETHESSVLVIQWPHGTAAWVRAATPEGVTKATADLESRFPTSPPTDATVEIDFWQVSNRTFTTSRSIEAPGDEIARNYPARVWDEIAALQQTEFRLDGGRIILWHGPPGTGKTTAIRSLARAWQDRARTQIILDPELVFGNSATLMHVLLADIEDKEKWRLLVVEDADELIRSDAKERVGQALSRLLNMSDGILGQGIRVLVLITTNEPVARLHPALIRPGRCLIETEFRRFDRAEAESWLDGDLPPGRGFSLAELTARQRGEPMVAAGDDHPGQYL